ncbi:MAG TPA: TetR/AcrR family transcriptional regulator [Jiangellaceae bacterium]
MRTVDPAKHQARRRQILDAAGELFATKGFDGTATADICKAAGMSAGNLFHYFSSKREIFYAVIIDGEDEKAAQLAEAQRRGDVWAALLDVIELLTWPATVPLGPPLVMEAMLQAQRDPQLAEWLERDQADEQAAVEALITRGVETGQLDPGVGPADAATWVIAMVGAFYLQVATDTRFRPHEQATNMRLVLRRFLRPR